MKKGVGLLLTMVLMFNIIGLTGCGNSADEESITPNSVEKEANQKQEENKEAKNEVEELEEVTVRIMTRWSDDAPKSVAFRDRLQQFMEENPHIKVEDISVNDEAAFNDKWKALVATGDLPEISQTYGGENFKQYIENNVIENLGDELTGDWAKNFLPLFENWGHNDGIYGVPYEFYAVGIFYNKAIFEEYGLETPETIDDLMEVSEALKSNGIIPMALGAKDTWRGGHVFNNLVMKKYGFPMYQALAERTVAYDDPEIVEIFTLMDDMNKAGVFGETIVGIDYNAEKEMFFSKRTAMHMDGSWFLGEASSSEIAENIGFIPFPYFADKEENKENWAGGAGAGLSIAANLDENTRNAAVKLLKFITSKEHFEYVQAADKGGIYPVVIETDPSVVDPITIAYTEAIANAKDFRGDVQRYDELPQMLDRARNSIQGMFAGNTPEEALAEIVEEIAGN